MANYCTCKSCGKRIKGRGKRWAMISPLCPSCYSYHCRNIITRSRLAEKIRKSTYPRPTSPAKGLQQPRQSFWGWLFG